MPEEIDLGLAAGTDALPAVGDVVFFTPRAADCNASEPVAAYGGAFVVTSASLNVTVPTAERGLRVCHKPAGSSSTLTLSNAELDAYAVSAASAARAVVGEPLDVTFSGIGIGADVSVVADSAVWVVNGSVAAACGPVGSGASYMACVNTQCAHAAAAPGAPVSAIGAGSAGSFTFEQPGGFELCFRFGDRSSRPWALYGGLEMDVISLESVLESVADPTANNTRTVVNAPLTLVFGGAGVGAGDRIYFVPPGEPCTTQATYDLDYADVYGGVQTLDGARSATFSFSSALLGLELCYGFVGYNDGGFVGYPAFTVDVLAISSPPLTVSVVTTAKALVFGGVGIRAGDMAKWVEPAVGACDGAALASLGGEQLVGADGGATFTLSQDTATTGAAVLCYKFEGEDYTLFADVRLESYALDAQALELVAGEPEALAVGGYGVQDGDRLFLVYPPTAPDVIDCAALSAGDPLLGGVVNVTDGRALLTVAAGVDSLQLCYQFVGEPFTHFADATVVVYEVLGPAASFAVVDVTEPVTFTGVGVKAGDRVKWINASATTCDESPQGHGGTLPGTATFTGQYQTVGAAGLTDFDFFSGSSLLQLCYRFKSAFGSGYKQWRLYPQFQATAADVTGPTRTVSVVDVAESIALSGIAITDADALYFSTECTGAGLSLTGDLAVGSTSADGLSGTVGFTPAGTGSALPLCYSFRGRAYKQYPGITLDAFDLAAIDDVPSAVRRGRQLATAQSSVAGVVSVAQTVYFEGVGVASGDEAFWVAPDATSCTCDQAGCVPHKEQTGGRQAVGATGSADFLFLPATGSTGMRLCYSFAAEPFKLYANLTLVVQEITGPETSIAVVSDAIATRVRTVQFTGVGVGAGDRAIWILPDETTCDVAADSGYDTVGAVQTVGADGTAGFTFFTLLSGATLCYQFSGLPWTSFETSAISVAFSANPLALLSIEQLAPTGSAFAVGTPITITGSGGFTSDAADVAQGVERIAEWFANPVRISASSSTSSLLCRFSGFAGTSAGQVLTTPVSAITSTTIVCRAPSATRKTDRLTLDIVADGCDEAEAADGVCDPVSVSKLFTVYDIVDIRALRITPAGTPQGLDLNQVTISGWETGDAVLNDYKDLLRLTARVTLPSGATSDVAGSLPDRGLSDLRTTLPYISPVGVNTQLTLAVDVSLDGFTFSSDAPTFIMYNALVESGSPAGGALGSTSALTLSGLGFVDLRAGEDVAVCIYTRSGRSVSVGARVAASDAVVCSAPTDTTSGVYTVSLSLNGGFHVDPFSFDPVQFELYDIDAVSVTSVQPPGGPVDGGTRITLSGTGFADYGTDGDDQLGCVLIGDDGIPSAPVAATLLSNPTRVLCDALPAASGASNVTVEVTLNAGADGSITSSGAQFVYYANPSLTAVSQPTASADGGEDITLSGTGFVGLSSVDAAFASYLRVRFGTVVASAPTSFDDASVSVTTPYGSEGASSITVSLNGQQWTQPEGVSIEYVGLHAPVIESATFAPNGNTIVVLFDLQPTNRGGMTSVGSCATVLDDATVATIRGTATTAPQCYWTSDIRLVAYLTIKTSAAPGMAVRTRAGVIAPLATPAGDTPKYADSSYTIDADFPCGTDVDCLQPTLSLSGMTQVSACPNDVLQIDGTQASNGGIKPLTYQWRVDPSVSDFAAELNVQLRTLDGAASKVLELSDIRGDKWTFQVKVKSFLGRESQLARWKVVRQPTPSPSLRMEAPAVLSIKPSADRVITGTATTASCFSGVNGILFSWSLADSFFTDTGVDALDQVPTELMTVLDAATTNQLLIPGLMLKPGCTYTMRLNASMTSEPTAYSSEEVTLQVIDETLVVRTSITARTLSAESPLVIDASASYDPNDPDDATAPLTFVLTSVPEIAILESYYSTDGRVISFPGGAFAADTSYVLTVTASKGARSASTDVILTVVSDPVPVVDIISSLGDKHKINSNDRLQLFGSATEVDGNAGAFTYLWTADGPALDLFSSLVTTTGATAANLVVRSNQLIAGATYAFMLQATDTTNGASSVADISIVVNRAPFGGALESVPETGDALTTRFELEANGWTDDDPDDLPLTYRFSNGASVLTEQKLGKFTSVYLEEGTHAITVHVYDYYQGRASAEVVVTANAVVIDEAKTNTVLELIGNTVAEGRSDEALSLISALAASSQDRRRTRQLQVDAADSVNGTNGTFAEVRATRLIELVRSSQLNVLQTDSSVAMVMQSLSAVLELDPSAVLVPSQLIAIAVLKLSADSASDVLEDDARVLMLTAVDHLFTAMDAALAAQQAANAAIVNYTDPGVQPFNASDLNEGWRLTSAGLVDFVLNSFMPVLLGNSIADEPVTVLSYPSLAVSTARVLASGLSGASLDAPEGAAKVTLPDGVSLLNALAVGGDTSVAVNFVEWKRNVYSGFDTAEPTLVTTPISFWLADASGAEYAVRNVNGKITIEIPLHPQTVVAGAGNCTEPEREGCSGNGQCVEGGCVCDNGWMGLACNEFARCAFWDEDSRAWQFSGVATAFNPNQNNLDQLNGTLVCTTSHLTDFAGVMSPPPPPGPSPDTASGGGGGAGDSSSSSTSQVSGIAETLFTSVGLIAAVAVITFLNILLVGAASLQDSRVSLRTRNTDRLKRLAARSAAAAQFRQKAKKPSEARIPLPKRIKFALEDNFSLLALSIGEADPGLRRPALLQTVFTQMMLILCLQAAFFAGGLPWFSSGADATTGAGALFLHATLVAIVALPALYITRLVFIAASRLSWASSPVRLVQAMIVTASMCFGGRRRRWDRRGSRPGTASTTASRSRPTSSQTTPVGTEGMRAAAEDSAAEPGSAEGAGIMRTRVAEPAIPEEGECRGPEATAAGAPAGSGRVMPVRAGLAPAQPPTLRPVPRPTSTRVPPPAGMRERINVPSISAGSLPGTRANSEVGGPTSAAGSTASMRLRQPPVGQPSGSACRSRIALSYDAPQAGPAAGAPAAAAMKRERVPPPWELTKRLSQNSSAGSQRPQAGGSQPSTTPPTSTADARGVPPPPRAQPVGTRASMPPPTSCSRLPARPAGAPAAAAPRGAPAAAPPPRRAPLGGASRGAPPGTRCVRRSAAADAPPRAHAPSPPWPVH